jgi:pyruvate kinase
MLARIAAATEPQLPRRYVREALHSHGKERGTCYADLISLSLETMLDYMTPLVIVVPTRSGATARTVARFKFPVWVAGISSSESTCRHLAFSYGVLPIHETQTPGAWSRYARERLFASGLEKGAAILIEGPSPKRPEANHRIEILDLGRPAV